MVFEKESSGEKLSGKKSPALPNMTLEKAIEMGEYDPEFLATFPEWHGLTRHIQFQYIRRALDNREHHLITQWAEIVNILDFRLKPHLKIALENIQQQQKILHKDRERLYLEYSK